MSHARTKWIVAVLAALCLASAQEARAAAVWQIISVELEGDPQPWLDLISKANTVRKRLALPPVRVVQATLAGDETGRYFVDIEYPSLAAFADAVAKLEADAEWPGLLKQFQTYPKSKVVENSLFNDRTPEGVTAAPLKAGGYANGLAVRVEGDPSTYLALLAKIEAAFKRLGVPAARIWQATLAGEGTGTILIITAYPSLAAYEEAQKKLDGDTEFQSLRGQAEATGRKIVSSVLVRERTPK
jgi:hypothetical protein